MLLTTVLILARWSYIPHSGSLLIWRLLILVCLILLPARGAAWETAQESTNWLKKQGLKFLSFVRHAYPLLLILFFFEEVEYTVNAFFPQHPHWFEKYLYQADSTIFGSLPAFLLAPWNSPLVNEIMHAFYFAYFPILIGGLFIGWKAIVKRFSRDRQSPLFARYWRSARGALSGMVIAYLFTFLFFPLLPARGPWENQQIMAQLPPFEGYLFTPLIETIIRYGSVSGGCFPSSHVSGSWGLVVGMGGEKVHRRTCLVLGIAAAAMSFACVYTRYHHGVDALAGIVIGLAAGLVGRRIARREANFTAKAQRTRRKFRIF